MGGKTAMEFALRYPDMTDKLVVVDIAPKTYPPGHDIIFKALRSINPATLADRQEAEDALAKDIDDAGIRLFLLKNLARQKEGGFRWKMNLEGIYQNYEQILKEPTASDPFHGEALFIRGKKSGYIDPGDESLIKQWFPEARLETMNAGHWVHAEDPDGLYDLVHGFLSA